MARQAEVVCGLDTTDAQNLLLVMQQTLDAVNTQRQQIVRELASIPGEEL
jgi:hypothetical protein